MAATTAATCSPMYLAAALTSSDGCRVLAGSEKSVSVGQKIGHIIGCPARLICRQPPASVASLVAHHTPVPGAGPQLRVGVGDLQHDRVDDGAGEAVLRAIRPPPGQVRCGPAGHRPVDDGQQRQVDVERVGDPPGPQPDTVRAGPSAGPAFQHQFAGRGVLAGLPRRSGRAACSACRPSASASPKDTRYVRVSQSAPSKCTLNS